MLKHTVTTLAAILLITPPLYASNTPTHKAPILRCIGQESPIVGGEVWHVSLDVNTNVLTANGDTFKITGYKELDRQTKIAMTGKFNGSDKHTYINILGTLGDDYYFVQYEIIKGQSRPRYVTDIKLACNAEDV